MSNPVRKFVFYVSSKVLFMLLCILQYDLMETEAYNQTQICMYCWKTM